MGVCYCTGACRNGGKCAAASDWGTPWPQPNTSPYNPNTIQPWNPATPYTPYHPPFQPYIVPCYPVIHGCICPVGAEQTCQGVGCPRKPTVISGIGGLAIANPTVEEKK